MCFHAKNYNIPQQIVDAKEEKLLTELTDAYNEMLRRLEPEKIICFGSPFDEMQGNIITVDYRDSRKVVR